MNDIHNIGSLFKKERKRIGLTGAEIGEKLGVTQSHISKIEKGVSTPTVAMLLKMKEIFGTDISMFFNRNNTRKEETDFEKELLIENRALQKKINILRDENEGLKNKIYELEKENDSFKGRISELEAKATKPEKTKKGQKSISEST